MKALICAIDGFFIGLDVAVIAVLVHHYGFTRPFIVPMIAVVFGAVLCARDLLSRARDEVRDDTLQEVLRRKGYIA